MPATTFWLMGAALVVLGTLGSVAVLAALGVVELPFLRKSAPPARSYEGLVAIPISARAIPLHTKVTRDDLFDAKTATLKVVHLPPDQVRPTMLTRLEDILGRVLRRDKTAGYAFTEDDFYPRGTRPGQSAGVPPGMRAVALDTEKLHGAISGLKAGDRFDVVATVQPEGPRLGARTAPVLPPGIAAAEAPAHPLQRPHVKLVVEGGVVVTALPPPPKKGSKETRTRKDHEIVVGILAGEVPQLEAALASNARLTVLARTGQPEEAGLESRVPDHDPPPPPPPPRPTAVIELFRGMKREVVSFYGAQGPFPASTSGKKTKGGR
jgi:hypothetical protein